MATPEAKPVELGDEEHEVLLGWSRRPKALALRSRIVLRCAAGGTNSAIAEELGVSRNMVLMWRARSLQKRLEGLSDEPRPGRG